MSKALKFIQEVISNLKFSITIKLPLINVTLTPSMIQQPFRGLLFFLRGIRGRTPLKREPFYGSEGDNVQYIVPACYTVRRTPQGLKKSGFRYRDSSVSLRCPTPKTTFLSLGGYILRGIKVMP